MEKLDRYLQENFDVPAKNPSEEAQRRWRQAVGTIVKNRRRRFRWVPDLERRSLDKAKVRSTQVLTNHELAALIHSPHIVLHFKISRFFCLIPSLFLPHLIVLVGRFA
jgi:hypothetical protein